MNNLARNKIKVDAYQPQTTYLNDFPIRHTIGKSKPFKEQHPAEVVPDELPPKKALYEDHETFLKLKEDAYLPFNLLWQPKPILQTHPEQKMKKLEPIMKNNDEVIKSRPRVYMLPACCIDDISDKNMRKILCDSMYTTEGRKAEKEGASNFKRKIPSIQQIITKDTVSLEVDWFKPLEHRFIKKAKEWDDKQARSYCDTTQSFWINKDPPVKCGACVNPIKNLLEEKTKLQISKAISDKRLRLAYDLPPPNYAGYIPRMPNGVSLEQKHISVTHPMLSVSQAIASRFIDK